MDCKTARLLLEFHRPRAPELDPMEAHPLDEHLARCPECDTFARDERRLDDHLGRALRQVEVPPGLQVRLLDRLAADRADRLRRRIGHALRGLAAAAALLLITSVGLSWWAGHRPAADAEAFWEQVKLDKVNPPDAERMRETFRRLHVDGVPPRDFRYGLLAAYGVGEFQGQRVAQMVFVNGNRHTQVFIVTAQQFDLSGLSDGWESEGGYPYHVRVMKPRVDQAYVIYYTGDDVSWLFQPDDAAAPAG
jgi:hypothetical protein